MGCRINFSAGKTAIGLAEQELDWHNRQIAELGERLGALFSGSGGLRAAELGESPLAVAAASVPPNWENLL